MRSKLSLGERITIARKRVGATQDAVAEICDTTRQQVSKWERGTAVPDLVQALVMARYLKTDLQWLIEDLAIDLCAPWELNPQPADCRSVAVQRSLFDDDWDSGGSSEPRLVIDLRDHPTARFQQVERLAS